MEIKCLPKMLGQDSYWELAQLGGNITEQLQQYASEPVFL